MSPSSLFHHDSVSVDLSVSVNDTLMELGATMRTEHFLFHVIGIGLSLSTV